MQQREHPGARDGEQRHRLGKAIDARAPILPHQQQHRRDERAGVADPDPPDEIDDRKAPRHGNVHAPDADAACEQIGDGEHQHAHEQAGKSDRRKPSAT